MTPPTRLATRARRVALLGLLPLAGLLLAYALSSGPALYLMQRRVLDQDLVAAVYFGPYAPLQMVVGIVPGGDAAMKSYVAFWESLNAPTPGE